MFDGSTAGVSLVWMPLRIFLSHSSKRLSVSILDSMWYFGSLIQLSLNLRIYSLKGQRIYFSYIAKMILHYKYSYCSA